MLDKNIPSGYLTVCHGKSPFSIGKPSINGPSIPWLCEITREYLSNQFRTVPPPPAIFSNGRTRWQPRFLCLMSHQVDVVAPERWRQECPATPNQSGIRYSWSLDLFSRNQPVALREISRISGWWCNFTILKHDGVRQWEGWHPIYEMENKSHVWNHQPLTGAFYVGNGWVAGGLLGCWHY